MPKRKARKQPAISKSQVCSPGPNTLRRSEVSFTSVILRKLQLGKNVAYVRSGSVSRVVVSIATDCYYSEYCRINIQAIGE
jgi:hypothetical protein